MPNCAHHCCHAASAGPSPAAMSSATVAASSEDANMYPPVEHSGRTTMAAPPATASATIDRWRARLAATSPIAGSVCKQAIVSVSAIGAASVEPPSGDLEDVAEHLGRGDHLVGDGGHPIGGDAERRSTDPRRGDDLAVDLHRCGDRRGADLHLVTGGPVAALAHGRQLVEER